MTILFSYVKTMSIVVIIALLFVWALYTYHLKASLAECRLTEVVQNQAVLQQSKLGQEAVKRQSIADKSADVLRRTGTQEAIKLSSNTYSGTCDQVIQQGVKDAQQFN